MQGDRKKGIKLWGGRKYDRKNRESEGRPIR